MHKIGRLQIYSILLLALILHLTVLDRIKIFGAKPDLLLIPVIFFGLFLGRRIGLECGLAAGVASDLFALDFLGINAFIYAVTGYLAGVLGAQFSGESKKTQGLVVMLLSVFSMALHFIAASILSRWSYLGLAEYLIGSVVPVSIYTALISIPIFVKLSNAYGFRRSEEYL